MLKTNKSLEKNNQKINCGQPKQHRLMGNTIFIYCNDLIKDFFVTRNNSFESIIIIIIIIIIHRTFIDWLVGWLVGWILRHANFYVENVFIIFIWYNFYAYSYLNAINKYQRHQNETICSLELSAEVSI